MENFREFVMELAETRPNPPLNPAHKTLLQARLNQWFSEYKTPDHPPYSAMIERALSELNEKNGSTEVEISHFIIKEYDSLPWAHLTLLERHLDTLSKSGNIILTRGKRYMLAEENTFLTSSTKGKKKKRRRKSRWAWERDRNKQQKKRNQPKGNRVDRIEELKESDEKLTENDVNNENKHNEGMMAVAEMECSVDIPQELEIDPSEIMNGHICGADKEEKQEEGQTNDNQLVISSPERPPGFESIIVENLSDSGIFLPQNQREESVSSPNLEQHLLHKKPHCGLLDADVLEVVQSVTIESESKEIKVYVRRTKTQPEQSQNTIKVVPMKSDVNLFEPNAIVYSQNSSMNEPEPRELLQQPPLVQGEALRDNPSHDEDASLIDVLQPKHQPEECQKTVLKRRGRPPKHKPIMGMCKILSPSLCQEMKNANQLHQEPPKPQTRQRQHEVEVDVMVGGNVKSIHSPEAEATRTDDLLLLGDLVPKPRRGRPPKH